MKLTKIEKVCLMDVILDNLKSGGHGVLISEKEYEWMLSVLDPKSINIVSIHKNDFIGTYYYNTIHSLYHSNKKHIIGYSGMGTHIYANRPSKNAKITVEFLYDDEKSQNRVIELSKLCNSPENIC